MNGMKSGVFGSLGLLLSCSIACSSGHPKTATNAAVTTAPPKKLAEDTPWKTPSGAKFTAPKGWLLSERASAIRLDDPDGELSIVLVVNKEANAEKAMLAAWKTVDPKFERKAHETVTPPGSDGWDEFAQTVYEVPSREGRLVIAIARRKGDTWHVALVDGSKAAFDRRAAQATSTIKSYKAPGAEEESFRGKTAHTLDAVRLQAFEDFAESARTKSKIPGAAIAIIQNGKVVYQKAFGVAELGKPRAVTPQTLFMIGSTTKSLTTAMMARLVDEQKFGWDTPVTELWPRFALGDPATTKQVTVRHTVCACTGLPRQDMELIFEYANVTPEQRLDELRAMKPTTAFGETFQYSNPLVAAGGYVTAHVAKRDLGLGAAYDAAMHAHVFAPLGMSRTTLDFAEVQRGDYAMPHSETLALEQRKISLGDEGFVVPVRPAGGAWSNVEDMSKYVLLELAKGALPDGTRIVQEASLLERRKPQVKITDTLSYGLGLFVEDDHGAHVVHHGGNTLGFTSDMFFLPEHGVGAVVLTNAGGANGYRSAVRRRLLEVIFDGKEEAGKNLAFFVEQKAVSTKKELAKIDPRPDKAWLAEFVGTYEAPRLGRATIRLEGPRAIFDAGEWQSAIGRMKDEDGTSHLVLVDSPHAGIPFLPEKQNGKAALVLELAQQKYVFTRTR